MTRWAKWEPTVQYLVGQHRLESFEAKDLAALAEALVARAVLRVETISSRSGSPSSSARISPCCWERSMGKSGGAGCLSTI
jgi:hypothetical protein